MTPENRASTLPLLDELAREEREALARLRRRHQAHAAIRESPRAPAASLATVRELEHQLERYVRFHDAVRSSLAWKLLQRARRLVGREW
jgi:hypothetical protein